MATNKVRRVIVGITSNIDNDVNFNNALKAKPQNNQTRGGVSESYGTGAHQCIPPPARGRGAGCTTRSQPAPRSHTAKPNTVTTFIHQPYLIHNNLSFQHSCSQSYPIHTQHRDTFIHRPYLIRSSNLKGTELTARHRRQQQDYN